MDPARRFAGKTAVITGGASGIGRATVRRLVAEGLKKVVIMDLDAEGGKGEIERAEAEGCRGYFLECDLANSDALRKAGSSAAERLEWLDVLVNCAGIPSRGGLVEQEFLEAFDPIVHIHLRAAALVTQVFLPLLKRRKGTIVNVSSDGGLRGRRGGWIYDAAKAALISLSKTMAAEFAPYGIRANAIAPGWTATEFHFMRAEDPQKRKRELLGLDTDSCLLRRLGRPEEIAAAVAFLASDDASYVTGTCLCVDGGRVGMEIPKKES